MIEIRSLTKRYGDKAAADDLSVTIRSGVVTGFLGLNGAGKSTTMRLVLGLARADSGEALVNGRRYAELSAPPQSVGALLDARAVHPGRTAYHHLLSLAITSGIPKARGPGDADPGRARQRSGPRRHSLGAQPPALTGSGRTDRLRILAPDERDGAYR